MSVPWIQWNWMPVQRSVSVKCANLVNDWGRLRDVPVPVTVTVTEETSGMTVDLTILSIAQGTHTTMGA